MQRATRNTFHQKGGEVQKIDQHGIWAIIESSYLNPEYERICIQGETPYDEDEVISVAKWVYRCRRLLRKKDHIIVILYNGEIFEPCYFIEPSIHTRFENGTLVWLEPLPQLNGYLLFPGGLPECTGSEYYYLYGSVSASGPSGIGSDSGYYGSVSVSGIDYGSGSGTSGISGTGGTSGTGIIDCSALLNCLCVQKDSQGRVTGVFIKNPDGSLTEIMDCGSGSGGSGISGSGGGLGYCCPAEGSEYELDYNFQVYGRQYTGTLGPSPWVGTLIGLECRFWELLDNPPCDNGVPPQSLDFRFHIFCMQGNYHSILVEANCWPNFCSAADLDFDISVSGCPGNPTINITVKPGHPCLSGSFTLRPV